MGLDRGDQARVVSHLLLADLDDLVTLLKAGLLSGASLDDRLDHCVSFA